MEPEEIEEEEYGGELFFNADSYKAFTLKYNIEMLDNTNYVNNDIHREKILVKKDERRTSEIMTNAEYTRVLAERASHIEKGGPTFAEGNSPLDIAIQEIKEKKCPFCIIRHLTKNIVEKWDVNEMGIPFR